MRVVSRNQSIPHANFLVADEVRVDETKVKSELNISEETRRTFEKISSPMFAELFTAKSAEEAFKHITV